MSPILLKTLNRYLGTDYTLAQALQYVAALQVLPMPDCIELDDWRSHVPMHLLETWSTLGDEERLTIYIMAQSATHPYEAHPGPEEPAMN